MRTLSLLLLGCTFLAACGGRVLPALPDGEQTVTGTLKAAELSAVRRGSHVIEQEGVSTYYAESALVQLREYENKRVTLRGYFEYNTDPEDLPVLVVDSIVDVEETQKEVTLPAIKVSLQVPVHWEVVQKNFSYVFSLPGEDGDEVAPLLTVSQVEGIPFPEGGVPIVVDATRASRAVDDEGNTTVYVKRDKAVLTLHFTPGTRLSAQRLQEDFVQLLSTVELLSAQTDTGTQFGSGTLTKPCGGSAGILCPEGFFCDIQDFEQNIGRCRKL